MQFLEPKAGKSHKIGLSSSPPTIPTRSCKPSLKQFCVGYLAQAIGIICIIHKLWSIKTFVVTVLSRNQTAIARILLD